MSPNFVKRIPVKGAQVAATEKCIVSDVGFKELKEWHDQIQLPFITNIPLSAAQDPALDRKWNWPAIYLFSLATNRAKKRAVEAFQLLIEGPNPNKGFVIVGQALLVHGYVHPGSRFEKTTFVWYLTSTPQNALNSFSVSNQYVVLPLLLDTAIQKSLKRGFGGRIALHADSHGTATQQERLIRLYKRYGLTQMAHLKGTFLSFFRPRIDGQYFTHSVSTAAAVKTLDYLR